MKTLLSFTAVLLLIFEISCEGLNFHTSKRLEAEKSYSRHAMEYHRLHPHLRKGDIVLETWSTADYIAQEIARRKIPGDWAATSDQLAFLEQKIRHDWKGNCFCVIQKWNRIIILYHTEGNSEPCDLESINKADIDGVGPGDMEFSGRNSFWIYVLNASQE